MFFRSPKKSHLWRKPTNIYSPKESSFLRTLRGVPLVECSHYLVLLVGKIFHPEEACFFIFYSPKESSLKNSPRGPIGRVLSLPCIIGWKIFSPRRSMFFYFLLCGWVVVVVVWGVLPFGTLDHVMTIFFKFLVL